MKNSITVRMGGSLPLGYFDTETMAGLFAQALVNANPGQRVFVESDDSTIFYYANVSVAA